MKGKDHGNYHQHHQPEGRGRENYYGSLFINLLVGIVGGVLGGWVFSLFGIAATGIMGSLVTSIVGAIFLLWIVSLLKRSDIS